MYFEPLFTITKINNSNESRNKILYVLLSFFPLCDKIDETGEGYIKVNRSRGEKSMPSYSYVGIKKQNKETKTKENKALNFEDLRLKEEIEAEEEEI